MADAVDRDSVAGPSGKWGRIDWNGVWGRRIVLPLIHGFNTQVSGVFRPFLRPLPAPRAD
jgi:hypothetical protein